MLKVALRHFLNPAFLELRSDMFSSWLGPSARGEKLWKKTPQVGKRALSRDVKDQRGSLVKESQGWHLLSGAHPICKNPTCAHHTACFSVACLSYTKENKHTDERCFSLSSPPAHIVTLPSAKLCLITGSLSLIHCHTHSPNLPWALSIYAFTDLSQWYTLMFILGCFHVCLLQTCVVTVRVCVCVYKHIRASAIAKGQPFYNVQTKHSVRNAGWIRLQKGYSGLWCHK